MLFVDRNSSTPVNTATTGNAVNILTSAVPGDTAVTVPAQAIGSANSSLTETLLNVTEGAREPGARQSVAADDRSHRVGMVTGILVATAVVAGLTATLLLGLLRRRQRQREESRVSEDLSPIAYRYSTAYRDG